MCTIRVEIKGFYYVVANVTYLINNIFRAAQSTEITLVAVIAVAAVSAVIAVAESIGESAA